MMLDLAIQQTGAVYISIYPNINISKLRFDLEGAYVKGIIFCDEAL
jgi:long-subunit acyl-CoA synthetase (AMP-forming)